MTQTSRLAFSSFRMTVFAGALCGLVFFTARIATASNYASKLWQMEDGLPHNIVQAIAQTRDGFLWVGTREGLARFDGTRFQVIKLTPELRHPSILCLLESKDGTLWIG